MVKEKEIVLVGWGKTSTPFSYEVANHLKNVFGFNAIIPPNLPHLRQLYIDGENRMSRPVEEIINGNYKGKVVYMVQDTRIYDNVALDIYRALLKNNAKLNRRISRISNPRTVNEMNEILTQSNDILKKLEPLVSPDFKTKTGAQMILAENSPDRQITKIKNMSEYFKDAGALHIALAQRKTSYEWNHNHQKSFEERGIWEAQNLRRVINEFSLSGGHSYICLHEHAKKEFPIFAKNAFLDFVSINPQDFSRVNNTKINLLDYFVNVLKISKNDIDQNLLYPFDHYLKKLLRKNNENHMSFFVDCVDQGAYDSSKEFAKRNELNYLEPIEFKLRIDEGKTKDGKVEPLDKYLDQLRISGIKNAIIYIILPDDKFNTGGTGNKHAAIRNQEIDDYNKAYSNENVNFESRVIMFNTHFRTPYIHRDMINVNNLYKVVTLDSVPYSQPLEEQLIDHNLEHIIEVINGPASFQIASGIAIEFNEIGRHYLNGTQEHKKVILGRRRKSKNHPI
jgi:hypothetical protein